MMLAPSISVGVLVLGGPFVCVVRPSRYGAHSGPPQRYADNAPIVMGRSSDVSMLGIARTQREYGRSQAYTPN
ncbi:hypothetical protein C8Q70DRAFT_991507, partial [Cubamyces menziesii]